MQNLVIVTKHYIWVIQRAVASGESLGFSGFLSRSVEGGFEEV